MLVGVVLAAICRCQRAAGHHAPAAALKSVLDQARAAVVYALQLAALAVLEVLVVRCVWMGVMATALLWQLVLEA